MKEIRVYTHSYDRFINNYKKLKKIADKSGIEFNIEIGELVEYETAHGEYHEFYKVLIPEVAPKIGGYEVIGYQERVKIDKTEFDKICMFKENESQFSHYGCDHCNTNRRRNMVFMLEDSNGEFIQVGSTCLNTYTNTKSLSYFTNYINFIEEMEDEERNPKEPTLYDMEYILSVAAYVMDKFDGGIYFNASSERSTAHSVKMIITSNESQDDIEEAVKYSEESQKIIEHFKNILANGEYLASLKNFATVGKCRFKDVGLIASAVMAYRKAMDELEKINNNPSNHVGEVKDRNVYDLEFVRQTAMEGFYGTTYFITFKDADGNIMVAKSTNNVNYIFGKEQEGMKVSVKATIKSHETFRGVKQTMINRLVDMTCEESEDMVG